MATGNWWGDASGATRCVAGIADYNPYGMGDPVSDAVAYRPWLTAPPLDPDFDITSVAFDGPVRRAMWQH